MSNRMLPRSAGSAAAASLAAAYAVEAASQSSKAAEESDAVEQAFRDVLKYEHGGTRKALIVLENHVNAAYGDAAARKRLIARFSALIESPEATQGCKEFACKKLMLFADASAVPVLARLIGADEKLAVLGRFALERMPDPAAGAALREAAGRAKGRVLVGVINSLGVRRDTEALGQLIRLLGDADEAVAEAAGYALAKIGGSDAAKALRSVSSTAPPAVKAAAVDGLLCCAERAANEGQKDQALAIYRELAARTEPAWVAALAKRLIEELTSARGPG